MEKRIKKVEDLRIWQAGHRLALEIYRLRKKFPKEELYNLTSQITRAAVSVPANITEGFYRETTKELIRFLYNARGSIGEVIYYLALAKDLDYIKKKEYQLLRTRYEELAKSVNALIRSLRKKL